MTPKSEREVERVVDTLASEPPEEPPQPWMAYVPRELWTDPVAALREWGRRADAHEPTETDSDGDGDTTADGEDEAAEGGWR